MQETKEYQNFTFLTANRPINRNHVNKIKKSLQEYGYLDSQPITMNGYLKMMEMMYVQNFLEGWLKVFFMDYLLNLRII